MTTDRSDNEQQARQVADETTAVARHAMAAGMSGPSVAARARISAGVMAQIADMQTTTDESADIIAFPGPASARPAAKPPRRARVLGQQTAAAAVMAAALVLGVAIGMTQTAATSLGSFAVASGLVSDDTANGSYGSSLLYEMTSEDVL
ncbi:MAG: hypothetical protein AAFV26_01240 [Pseudomonadota bacterium]